jgi:hypothetical protein
MMQQAALTAVLEVLVLVELQEADIAASLDAIAPMHQAAPVAQQLHLPVVVEAGEADTVQAARAAILAMLPVLLRLKSVKQQPLILAVVVVAAALAQQQVMQFHKQAP